MSKELEKIELSDEISEEGVDFQSLQSEEGRNAASDPGTGADAGRSHQNP